jgi:FtsZ-interacting cell division protein ZipA
MISLINMKSSLLWVIIVIIIIIIIIIINCNWAYTKWQCATMKDRTIQHNKITHTAQNYIQHLKHPSIGKITRKNQEHNTLLKLRNE